MAKAQDCPDNIDFENGNFSGWTCYTGETSAIGNENLISLYPRGGPVAGSHQLFNANSNEVDFYGGFPVHCPNGSGHSVKLGNTEGGGQAEGMSYEFTIPDNQNSYILTYYYAVVFQSPNHRPNEQPRMETEVTNLTDGTLISCASFAFIAMGTSIPGFHVSPVGGSTEVLYKDWTAVSVDLSGNAGKRIRLFFKTADCTFRRHFGYAYIDVNSECNGNLTGATYCPDDTAVNIIAPYGYQQYTWYNQSGTAILGTQQVLSLAPPPPSGTSFAVKLEPYEGYGCPATVYTKVMDSLTVTANAGPDRLSCNGEPVQLGVNPKAGLVYEWSPVTDLSNPEIANPFFTPGAGSTYVVKTRNSGGGCRSTDTVNITTSAISNQLQLTGRQAFCYGQGDSARLQVSPEAGIEWWKDGTELTAAANQTVLQVETSGTYTARLTNSDGCTLVTEEKTITIDHETAGIRYPARYAVANVPLALTARDIGVSVSWEPAAGLSNHTSFNPVFTATADQEYLIKITSAGGCLTTDSQQVKVVPHVKVFVPTAFTPNNDGRNDLLRPVFVGVAVINSFRVYNRWGQLLFEGSGEQTAWDGYFKGEPQPSQTLTWTAAYIGLDGEPYQDKGTALLLR